MKKIDSVSKLIKWLVHSRGADFRILRRQVVIGEKRREKCVWGDKFAEGYGGLMELLS